jgi:hypothetical protein
MDEDKESKKRRVCRAGCGVEATPGKCDSPGFKNRARACIVQEIQGYKRFELPRRRPKKRRNIMPTSMALVYGWRANCDVKILLYESNPQHPDAKDIAKVTNYLVTYASKGVESVEAEKSQLRSIIMSTEETSGCEKDIVTLARRILNRYLGEKMMSKQECMVQLGGLHLWTCSETFQRISLSGYTRLDKNGTKGINTYLKQYAERTVDKRRMSFMDWYLMYHAERSGRTCIPHFPGRGSKPIFPMTEYMSRMLLLIHKPWSKDFRLRDHNYCQQLRSFLQSTDCPVSLRLAYERDKYSALNKLDEPVDSSHLHEELNYEDDADEELREAVECYAVIPTDMKPEKAYDFDYDFGYEYDWCSNHTSYVLGEEEAASWLENEIRTAEAKSSQRLQLPVNPHTEDGTYAMGDLKNEQRNVALEVIAKLKEWCECRGDRDKMKAFTPLRLTIRGKAGTGKTTLIHTLVTIVRNLFGTNDCVAIVCPSGCAAANAGGKTVHNRFRVPIRSKSLIPGTKKRSDMIQDNKRLAMIIVDERSMVAADVLGRMFSFIEQTAHGGNNADVHGAWAGVPVVLLLGDDGQLPPIGKGAFDWLEPRQNLTLATIKGLEVFRKMGEKVRTLGVIQRQEEGQDMYREILEEAYAGIVSDINAERLMEYHLDNDRFTGDDKRVIKERSIHVFANIAPMEIHNNACLFRDTSGENPVARIRAKDYRNKTSHVQSLNLPKAIILARGSKVCLNGRNLRPEWGLYNNCTGTVMDIVFEQGESPNEKHLPKYVLVDFTNYTGPAFIDKHPTIVPIAPIVVHCEHNCCSRTQIPLRLAYGQTIHTFQGITVGPSTSTKRYATQSIIIDPGTLAFEGHSPGLFYSSSSRGTTLGTKNDPLSSSIYFQGKSMSKERVTDMVHGQNGRVFYRVYKRDIWTAYLDRNNRTVELSTKEAEEILNWVESTRLNSTFLDKTIGSFNRHYDSTRYPDLPE